MSRFFCTFAGEMNKIGRIIILFLSCVAIVTYGQDIPVEDIM